MGDNLRNFGLKDSESRAQIKFYLKFAEAHPIQIDQSEDKDNDFLRKPAPYPKLNLPSCRLRVTERAGATYVWDALRGRWLALTPEEWVRRHVIAFLSESAGVAAANICQEYPVDLNGAHQRADIVVTCGGQPLMLVECKAPGVAVCGSTLDQAFRYNAVAGARYVMLTNGLDHYLYEVAGGEYIPLKDFPDLLEH